MNKDWKEEYGGHFELWDRKMTTAVKKVLPVFNRCAIFSTTSTSYHGHPHPLTCPPDRTRKSIATYYYSNGRPEEEKTDSHSTLFKRKRGVDGKYEDYSAKQIARMFVPPIIMEAYWNAKRKKA